MSDAPPPRQPVAIYDGRCGFCRLWIDNWRELTSDHVHFLTSQQAEGQFPQISGQEYARAIQLVLPDGTVLSGAHAVYQLLTYAPGRSWPLKAYAAIPGVAAVSEWAYRFIAAHRSVFYWITVLLFGREIRPARYHWVEWVFLRALALVYLVAFVSIGVQIRGLIGSRGILPVGTFLTAATDALGGGRVWHQFPTLFWFWHTDTALVSACVAGAALAVVLLLGFFERPCLIALYVLYLSICSVGQDFLAFQWDLLLLEAGFLAIFLGSSHLIVWMFRVLVFRLMFSSGAVKLLSGDPTWRSFRAMTYHYFTQPIPNPVAWYAQQLPGCFQQWSTAAVLVIELVTPFLIFLPRRLRLAGAACLIGLQVLILLTGNFAFFNWLSIALCLFLLDDRLFPRRPPPGKLRVTRRAVAIAAAVLVLTLGALQFSATLGAPLTGSAAGLVRMVQPFGIVNTYGLFAVMTTQRLEITVQGSNDGVNWLTYEFKYKPGPLWRPPPWVAPHQPRLDWQMWFAALSTLQGSPWFVNFAVRLLEGSPDVIGLLNNNPFPHAPPRYVRALASQYRFTDWDQRRTTGDWWTAEPAGVYLRPISLADIVGR
jgi:predicted DCC family thiol-disulfide oxidoreductase YuxK